MREDMVLRAEKREGVAREGSIIFRVREVSCGVQGLRKVDMSRLGMGLKFRRRLVTEGKLEGGGEREREVRYAGERGLGSFGDSRGIVLQ